ncbi:MAG: lipocalin family protein [Clostridia bacterium]|nr:lipocalin family protein [Clostridia bacterium]
MKKALVVVAALMIAMTCMLFTACGGGIEGTYKIKSVSYNGTTYNIGDSMDGEELKSDTYVVVVNKDGTFTFNETYETHPEYSTSMSGTWKLKEGDVYEITLSYDAEHQDTFEATIKDGTMTFSVGSAEYVLVK